MVSAIWHGFYFGYYIFFGIINIMLSVSRKMRIIMKPIPRNTSNVLGWLATHHFAYCIMPAFGLQTFENIHAYLKNFSYYPILALLISYVILNILPVEDLWSKNPQNNDPKKKGQSKSS